MLREVIKSSEERTAQFQDEVKADLVLLEEDKIKSGCHHCNWCLTAQTADTFCAVEDILSKEIYSKIIETDALIMGTPVYMMGMSWVMASFIQRLRALAEGRYYGFQGPFGDGSSGILKDKVFASVSIALGRRDGVEIAMLNELSSSLLFGMIPATAALNGCYGAGGFSDAKPDELVAVKKDKLAITAEKTLGKRIVDLCRMIKAGKKALKHFPAYI